MFNKFIFVASTQDKAGINIKEELEKLDSSLKTEIFTTEKRIVYAENIDKEIEKELKEKGEDFDFLIFISKHQSEKHNKTLSVHVPGNWKKAELGGKEKQVCSSSAFFLKHLFIELNRQNKLAKQEGKSDYICTLECTHHGPYVEKPCCFIEIGSSETEWQDTGAGKIIAQTLINAIKNWLNNKTQEEKIKNWVSCIGIGGKHYCQNLNKIQLNSKYAFCHVIPEYALPLDKNMLKQAIEKTIEKTKLFILDWKGLGNAKQRQETINLLNEVGLEYIRTNKIEK